MSKVKRFLLVFLSLFFCFIITAQADVILNYDDVVAEIKRFDSTYHSSGVYHLAQYDVSEGKYYFYFSDGQYKLDDTSGEFSTVGRMNIHCYSVEVTDGAYTIKFCYDSTHFPFEEFIYSNIDVLTNNEKDVYFSATSTGGIGSPSETPDDSLNIDDEYSDDAIKSEKGKLIRIILDPIFTFINFITGFLPDLSSPTESNWLKEFIQVFNYASWFFPKDVALLSFVSIASWMCINLSFAFIQFVVRFFTLRI